LRLPIVVIDRLFFDIYSLFFFNLVCFYPLYHPSHYLHISHPKIDISAVIYTPLYRGQTVSTNTNFTSQSFQFITFFLTSKDEYATAFKATPMSITNVDVTLPFFFISSIAFRA